MGAVGMGNACDRLWVGLQTEEIRAGTEKKINKKSWNSTEVQAEGGETCSSSGVRWVLEVTNAEREVVTDIKCT